MSFHPRLCFQYILYVLLKLEIKVQENKTNKKKQQKRIFIKFVVAELSKFFISQNLVNIYIEI